MPDVTVIGAGLAGSLLAIYLAKRGRTVEVCEARGDMRLEAVAAGRSINLALSDRGILALRRIGMDEQVLADAVPMLGRMIHAAGGGTRFLPYSGRKGEFINSVSRAGLNIALINEAEKFENVTLRFGLRCVGFDWQTGRAIFSTGEQSRGGTVIATDGAGSAVRQAMMNGGVDRFDYSQKWLDHGYKELHIPAADAMMQNASPGPNAAFAIEKNALHIWPRHKFMMIALPNFDGSFTCTLFLAHKADGQDGGRSFADLTNAADVQKFFNEEFSDVVDLMPNLADDFLQNPTGDLGTVKCSPWNAGGRALLLGDAAHAIVPFYGQGMNCAFEDVRVLDELIDKHDGCWQSIYEEFGRVRKADTDAIADMAEENFYEMRDAVADPVFLRKREIETKLEQIYPDYFSKYSMVTFREDVPYAAAKERGNAQDRILMEICARGESVNEINLDDVMAAVNE